MSNRNTVKFNPVNVHLKANPTVSIDNRKSFVQKISLSYYVPNLCQNWIGSVYTTNFDSVNNRNKSNSPFSLTPWILVT